jgi:hypothetical protein
VLTLVFLTTGIISVSVISIYTRSIDFYQIGETYAAIGYELTIIYKMRVIAAEPPGLLTTKEPALLLLIEGAPVSAAPALLTGVIKMIDDAVA